MNNIFFWSMWRHSDVLMIGQSLQIQADVYVCMFLVMLPSIQYLYVFLLGI